MAFWMSDLGVLTNNKPKKWQFFRL